MKKVLKNKGKILKLTTLGFTLIELLAVVIILAIIALIAVPIILEVVEESRNSANMSSAQLIVSSGHNYYAASLLDEEKQLKIENGINLFPEIEMSNKPESGQLFVNKSNNVAMAVVIDNKCYKKTFYSEIEVVDVNDCDLGYMGPDDVNPNVSQKVLNTTINENGWYKEDLYVEIEVTDNESGPAGYRRCMGQNECEPTEEVFEIDNKILINTESENNFICVIGIDNKGNESEKNCVSYKLDKTAPTLIAKNENIEINEKDSNVVSNYFTVSYGISGGSMSCSPVNTNSLSSGIQTVSCTAIGGSGLTKTAVKQITVKAQPVSFATDSWKTIADAVKNNNTSKYNVGDTKEVTLTGYGTFTVRIANMTTPSECATEGFSQTACGFVVEFVDIITKHSINSTDSNLGGWPASEMYNFVNSNIYSALPSDLQNVIVNTYSVSGHGKRDSSNFTSINKLYLLSTKEVWGIDTTNSDISYDSARSVTRQLDYYERKGVSTIYYYGARKTYQGNEDNWCLRSANSDTNNSFFGVSTFGTWTSGNAIGIHGVAPAFRIE